MCDTRHPAGRCWRSAGSLDVPLDAVLDGRAAPAGRVLTHVRDPGNAGTVIRGADAAGADAVLRQRRQRRRLQPQGRAVHRRLACSTCRSCTGVPVDRRCCTTSARGRAAAAGRRRRGHGPAARRRTSTSPHAWVFGNEAWGLRAGGARGLRRGRAGADPRQRRVAQPRDGGHGLPLRLRQRAARCRTEWLESRLMAVGPGHLRAARVPSACGRRRLRPAPRRPRRRRRERRSSSSSTGRPSRSLGHARRGARRHRHPRRPSRCRTTTAGRWWACTDPWGGLAIRTGHRERLLIIPGGGEVLVTARYVRPGRSQPVNSRHRRHARRRGTPPGRARPAPR